jgi:flagellar motor component MotA
MKKTAVIWMVLALGVVVFAIITSGGKIIGYINIPCFVMVFGTSFLLSLCNFNPKEMGRAFKAAFSGAPADGKELHNALVFFKSLQRYAVISGVLGTMTGVIALLPNAEDTASLGPNFSLALITLYYGVIFAIVICTPCIIGVKRKIANIGV